MIVIIYERYKKILEISKTRIQLQFCVLSPLRQFMPNVREKKTHRVL